MGLSEEKRAKLTDILTCLHGLCRDVGNSLQHACALAAAASSPVPSNPGVSVLLTAVQPSPTSLPCRGKVVVIESNEDSAEGSNYKKPKPTPVMVSHSSSSGRFVSPRCRTISVSLLPDLGGTGVSTPLVPELPLAFQHAIQGFQKGVTVDPDEVAARERLGFNFGALLAQFHALLSRAKSGDSLLARSFVAREATSREELVHLSKLLHTKRQEVTTLEARVLSLWVRVFELEEVDEESKAKITGLEQRSTSLEAQLDRAKAEFRQQAKRFEEAEADLTRDVLDAYDEGFKDALAQVACVHPGMDTTPFSLSNLVENGKIVPRVLP